VPLPESGEISLDEIHVEAGGTTSTEGSINDTDIRGLIEKSASVAMSFSEWYGASAQSIVANLGLSSGATYSDQQLGGDLYAKVTMSFASDGQWTIIKDSGLDQGPTGFLSTTGAGEANNYYIKWQSTGTNPTSAMTENTYYQLNATRTLYVEQSGAGTTQTGTTDVLTVTIAEDASGTGAVTWSGDLRATVESV